MYTFGNSSVDMEGCYRILNALDYALDNYDTELTYAHIANGKSSIREVGVFDGGQGCKTWLRAVNAFSRVKQLNKKDTVNMAYMMSRDVARDFIEELFIKDPTISWDKLYFIMLIRFTQLTGPGGVIQDRTRERLDAFERRWSKRKITVKDPVYDLKVARLSDK